MVTTIENVVAGQAAHLESITHGEDAVLSTALSQGELFAQGDLNVGPVTSVPSGYTEVLRLTEKHKQLVPGNTIGSRHCLQHLNGVRLWIPKEWSEESLNGPVILFSEPNRITHPTHGDLVIDQAFAYAGILLHCCYQQNWDEQEKRERRARD